MVQRNHKAGQNQPRVVASPEEEEEEEEEEHAKYPNWTDITPYPIQ
jgi:hypothetical protein